MPSSWLSNNKVLPSIVTVEGKDYLVYSTIVGSTIPKLIEQVDTGKRIQFNEIRNEISVDPINPNIDELVHLMISKIK
ncbi:hypothetical protein SLL00_16605 [Metabacillus indicus]|uniref:hypothetical protein n=1 Tax=Metabacillus indicus TaxID=246786 RepID=UPI002A06A80D|nr:hypothetical protein [Metabacillus indicus]MDX8291433.1 hypothetical protein [Metabacillus indicus]